MNWTVKWNEGKMSSMYSATFQVKARNRNEAYKLAQIKMDAIECRYPIFYSITRVKANILKRLVAAVLFVPTMLLAAPMIFKTARNKESIKLAKKHWSVSPYMWSHGWAVLNGKFEEQRW